MNQKLDNSDNYEDWTITPNNSRLFHRPPLLREDLGFFNPVESHVQRGQHSTEKPIRKHNNREYSEKDDYLISTRVPHINSAYLEEEEQEEQEEQEPYNMDCGFIEEVQNEKEFNWKHETDVKETEMQNEKPHSVFEYTCSMTASTLEEGDRYFQTTSEFQDENEKKEEDIKSKQKTTPTNKISVIPDNSKHSKTSKYSDKTKRTNEQSDILIYTKEEKSENKTKLEKHFCYEDGTVKSFQTPITAKRSGCSCKTSFEGPNKQLYILQTLYATGLKPVCICSSKMFVAFGSSSGFVHVLKVNPLSRSVRQLDEAGTLIAAFKCFEEEGRGSVGVKSISFITQNFLAVGGSNGSCCILKIIKRNRESCSFTNEGMYVYGRENYLSGDQRKTKTKTAIKQYPNNIYNNNNNNNNKRTKSNVEGGNNNINLINRSYDVIKCATVHHDAAVVGIIPNPLNTTTLYTLISDKGLYKFDLLTRQVGRVNDTSLPLTSISRLSNSVDKLICATTTGEGIVVNSKTLKILHRFKIVKNARRMRVRIYSVDDFIIFHCDDDIIRLFSSITFKKLAKYIAIRFVNRSNGDLIPFISRVESGRGNVENVFLIICSMSGSLKVFRPFKYHLPISVFGTKKEKIPRASVIKLYCKYKIGEKITTLVSMESVETEVLDSNRIPFKLEFSTMTDLSCLSTEAKHRSITAIVKSIKNGKKVVIPTRDSRQIVFVASTSSGRIIILLLVIS